MQIGQERWWTVRDVGRAGTLNGGAKVRGRDCDENVKNSKINCKNNRLNFLFLIQINFA